MALNVSKATEDELQAELDRINAIEPASEAQEERLSRQAERIERELEERDDDAGDYDIDDQRDNETLAGDYGSEYQI